MIKLKGTDRAFEREKNSIEISENNQAKFKASIFFDFLIFFYKPELVRDLGGNHKTSYANS